MYVWSMFKGYLAGFYTYPVATPPIYDRHQLPQRIGNFLKVWSEDSSRPLVIFIDEIGDHVVNGQKTTLSLKDLLGLSFKYFITNA